MSRLGVAFLEQGCIGGLQQSDADAAGVKGDATRDDIAAARQGSDVEVGSWFGAVEVVERSTGCGRHGHGLG